MNKLPCEIILNILKYLPQGDLLNCRAVCIYFNDIIKSYNMIENLVITERCDLSVLPAISTSKYRKVVIKDNKQEFIQNALKSTGNI